MRGARKTVLVFIAVASLAVLTGCGSSSKHSTGAGSTPSSQAGYPKTPVTTSPTAAEQATVVAWAKADTAQAVCAVMSYGFKLGLAHALQASPANCVANATKALAPFKSTSAHIVSAVRLNGQTRITAMFGGRKATVTLWLVRQCGSYKVNSINAFHPNPPIPRC